MDFLSTRTKISGCCREVAVSGDSTVVNYCIIVIRGDWL